MTELEQQKINFEERNKKAMEINTISRQAVEKFGRTNQMLKAFEEMGELMTALVQYENSRVTADDVITEIADVIIMMEQLSYMFGEDGVECEYIHKLDRLKKKLDAVHLSDEENDAIVLREAQCLEYMSYARRDELLGRCRFEKTRTEISSIFNRIRAELLNE